MISNNKKEERMTLGYAEDIVSRCRDWNCLTNTGFLNLHMQSLVKKAIKNSSDKTFFYGGYPDAERQVLICLPEYLDKDSPEIGELFSVIRVEHGIKKGRTPRHGDYLGSILGLGIDRNLTGDIFVHDYGADIIILTEIAEFIEANFFKVGNTSVSISIEPISELIVPKAELIEKNITVASMRVDNIVSACFNIPRTKAVTAISQGLVFINHEEIQKPDYKVSEGDSVVLRHSGRVKISEITGKTRKDRLHILYTTSK